MRWIWGSKGSGRCVNLTGITAKSLAAMATRLNRLRHSIDKLDCLFMGL